jgi:RNA polymerase sigma-70 factor (ECF subfamily)
VSDADAPLGVTSDADLVTRSARGDRDAFSALVERHQARVYRFARGLARDDHEAEDLLQQTFLGAWLGARLYRGDASVRTWLFTIARNAAFQARARRGREPVDEMPLEELGVAAGWGVGDPELLASRAQRRDLLAGALARLEPLDREVLTLRELEGLTGEETAASMGLGLAAMKSRLHRARLRLAAELRKGAGHAAGRT